MQKGYDIPTKWREVVIKWREVVDKFITLWITMDRMLCGLSMCAAKYRIRQKAGVVSCSWENTIIQ